MTKELENTFLDGIELNKEKLHRICSVYATDRETTKDLFQEVLIAIWESMPNFKNKSSLGTWMFRVTLNVCLRFKDKNGKKQSKTMRMDSIMIANIKETEVDEVQNEQLISLRKCIKSLNEADRAVITLYLEELPYKEISNILGLTENTIAVKIKRIKSKLLNCINKKLW